MSEKKLDIFRTLGQADLGNLDFYSELTDDEKSGFAALVVMRWLSSVGNNSQYKDYYLQLVNQFVNVNFWDLSKHPELQWKLMAACGSGTSVRHNWIPNPKRPKTSKLEDFMFEYYPRNNLDEIRIIINGFTKETFREFASGTGIQDKEINEICKVFDKERKV